MKMREKCFFLDRASAEYILLIYAKKGWGVCSYNISDGNISDNNSSFNMK